MSIDAIVQITPDSNGKKIDNALVNTSEGNVYRQRVEAYQGEIFDVDTGLDQPLTDALLRATPVPVSLTSTTVTGSVEIVNDIGNSLPVTFGDTTALDAFQRLRVSASHTLFDSQTEYGLDTIFSWDCTANGTISGILSPNGSVTSGSNAVGPRNANTRLTPITCSSTNGHYSILQSRKYTRYIPAFGQVIFISGIFTTNNTYTASITLRTSTSGTPSDLNTFTQANWNIDKMDGAGVSGITLDLTKTQILFITAQWLGVGRVCVGFDINGKLYPVHQFLNANNLTVPYCQTFNLPVRLEVETSGSTTIGRIGYFDNKNGVFLSTTNNTAGGTIYLGCASVQSEGAEEAKGYPRSQNPGIAAITVTTRRPIFSIRPAALFQGITNRSHIELNDYWLTAATNSSIFEIVAGGILTNASWKGVGEEVLTGSFVPGIRYKITVVGDTNWVTVGATTGTLHESFVALNSGNGTTGRTVPEYSSTEYDISATAITSGIVIATGEVLTGSGSTRGNISGAIDFRSSLTLSQINALTARQLPVSIVCTSTSGNSNVRGGITWYEQTV